MANLTGNVYEWTACAKQKATNPEALCNYLHIVQDFGKKGLAVVFYPKKKLPQKRGNIKGKIFSRYSVTGLVKIHHLKKLK